MHRSHARDAFLGALSLMGLMNLAACPGPDCQAICGTALACDVTFTPEDDPYLEQVESGSRSAQASCEQGCRESLSVDAAAEQCIQEVRTGDPQRCRPEVLSCLGLDADA